MEIGAHIVAHALDEAEALDGFEIGEGCGGAYGMTRVGVAVGEIAAIENGLGDFVTDHCRAEWEVATGYSLGEGDDVGIEIPEIAGEPISDSAEGGDDLVGDEEDVVFAKQIAQLGEVARRRGNDAARALDRLDEHGGDGFRALLTNRAGGFLDAPFSEGFGVEGGLDAVGMRAGNLHESWQGQVEGFVADGQTGHARGGEGDSVVGVGAREDFVFSGLFAGVVVGADDFQSTLVGFGSGVGKECSLDAGGGFFCEKVGDADGGFGGGIEERGVIRELAHLLVDGLDNGGAVVTDIHAPEAGETVEEAAVVLVYEETPIAGLDDMRAGFVHVGVVGEGMEVELAVEFAQCGEGGAGAHRVVR